MITQENIPYTADEIKAMVKTCEKYNKALERAQKMQENSNGMILKKWLWNVFPELRENKDERTRKELINFLTSPFVNENITDEKVAPWIAWLEKQGEKKSSDKVEPKFKVGDFITNDYCLGKVIEITNDAYLLDTGQGIPFSCEHNAHLWTIEDAKDSDVLVSKDDRPFIFTGEFDVQDDNPTAYCGINSNDKFITGKGSHWTFKDGIKPATNEQRELLFSKMKEAGYEWDSEKKELKKIEVASKESEDEKTRKELIAFLEENLYLGYPDETWDSKGLERWIAWLEKQGKEEYALKSFRDEDVYEFMQYIEKQAKAYEFNLPNRSYDIYAFAKDILHWLEKQGEKKPDSQMEKCSKCQFVYTGYCDGTCILENNEQKSK